MLTRRCTLALNLTFILTLALPLIIPITHSRLPYLSVLSANSHLHRNPIHTATLTIPLVLTVTPTLLPMLALTPTVGLRRSHLDLTR